jgi:hypothetical protein
MICKPLASVVLRTLAAASANDRGAAAVTVCNFSVSI